MTRKALIVALVIGIVGGGQCVAAAPKLNYFYPAGGQRGQTVAVASSGDFSSWPVQAWSDRAGLTVTCEKDKGKLSIAVAADAGAGTYWLRLADGEGASALRPFIVGTLPSVLDSEPNDSPAKGQALEPKSVVHGKLAKSGDVDGFRVTLNAGETLVASLQANSILGSPMDSVLQVCELVERTASGSQSPRIEAFVLAQNHDAWGLDPQLVFTAPRAGSYLVRLFAFPSEPNSSISFAGGENFIYRLTLTTGGYIDHALPLALAGDSAQVQPGGWNIPPELTTLSTHARGADDGSLEPGEGGLSWLFHPDLAGAVALPRIDRPGILAEETSSPNAPQEVTLPVVISGRLEADGDADAFALTVKKEDKVQLNVESRELGFPVDALIVVLDDGGKVVAEQDDSGRDGRDPRLTFTAPADGRYRAVVSDLHGRGGLRMVYRLSAFAPVPDFSLSLAADSFVLEKDKPLEIAVNVAARDGFREKVELRVVGLPPGVSAEPVVFEPKGDAPSGERRGRGRRGGGDSNNADAGAKLVLKADANAIQPGGGPIRIEGRTLGENGLVRPARFSLNLPLNERHWAAWLTVRK